MLSGAHPKAGVDYPSGWPELHAWFPDEAACRLFLERVRWPLGFVCPACGVLDVPWRQSRGRLTCRSCKRETSVTAGTIFEKTRTPLTTWFAAAWYVTNQKTGASALGLQRVLGLGSYQTAWLMLHKLRRAMVRPGREPLGGIVEVDETYVGSGEGTGAPGRSLGHKTLVVIAVEVFEPRGLGRVRMRCVPDATNGSLIPFVRDAVAVGSVVRTDGWRGYLRLPRFGFVHERRSLTASDDAASKTLPGVHRVASLLKRWLMGTLHGAVRPQHLPEYLDEFAFRFNRRAAHARGLLFYRLIEQAVMVGPSTYTQVTQQAIGSRDDNHRS